MKSIITEETKQSIDGHTTTKRIIIEWLEWKENKDAAQD